MTRFYHKNVGTRGTLWQLNDSRWSTGINHSRRERNRTRSKELNSTPVFRNMRWQQKELSGQKKRRIEKGTREQEMRETTKRRGGEIFMLFSWFYLLFSGERIPDIWKIWRGRRKRISWWWSIDHYQLLLKGHDKQQFICWSCHLRWSDGREEKKERN